MKCECQLLWVVLLFLLVWPRSSGGALIVVNQLGDSVSPGDGLCGISEAVRNADSNWDNTLGDCASNEGNPGEDTIVFSEPGFIALESHWLELLDSERTSIIGELDENGEALTTLSGSGVRPLLQVTSTAVARVENIRFIFGRSGFGGAINNNGHLDVIGCSFENNVAFNHILGGVGGAILSEGVLSIRESEFVENSANFNAGAVYASGPTEIVGSTFLRNTAAYLGGAILSGGATSIANSTLSSNSSLIGGGIHITYGETRLINSTLSGNDAPRGGGNLQVGAGAAAFLANTLLTTDSVGGNCGGQIGDGGGNLEDGFLCGFTDPRSQSGANPGLLGIAENGGRTETHALLRSSDAIDSGIDEFCASSPVSALDQRGEPRPIDGDADGVARCDVGAFELGPSMGVVGIPTLSPLGLSLFAGAFALFGAVAVRRMRRPRCSRELG